MRALITSVLASHHLEALVIPITSPSSPLFTGFSEIEMVPTDSHLRPPLEVSEQPCHEDNASVSTGGAVD